MELIRGEERVMLQPGQPAPSFDLPDADLNMVSLEEFKNQQQRRALFLSARRHAGLHDGGDRLQRARRPDFTRLTHRRAGREHGRLHVARRVPRQARSLRAAPRGSRWRSLPALRGAAGEGTGRAQEEGIVRSTFIIDRKGLLKHALYGVTRARTRSRSAGPRQRHGQMPIGKDTVVSLHVSALRHRRRSDRGNRRGRGVSARRLRRHVPGGREGARRQEVGETLPRAPYARRRLRRLRCRSRPCRAARQVSRTHRSRHAVRGQGRGVRRRRSSIR